MLSNNQAVKLYDAGDKVKIGFTVPKSTTYILKIRLRAGNYLNTSSYIPTGYVYSVDGEKTEFSIEDGSISALDESFGKSTWGTVVSNLINLDEGEHALEVEALISWSLIDYIEIIEVDNASLKESDASSTLASELTSEELNNLNVSVYPNPTSDILKVSLDTNTDEYGEIILMDSFGKVVYSEDVTSFDSETIINVTNFTKGFYLLNVQIGGVKNVKRVMIK
ncbi:MAG: hypothetical protein CMO01_06335 [Thalassobius sp.]|nr:hypothetical protein [Thalassovita sp.]